MKTEEQITHEATYSTKKALLRFGPEPELEYWWRCSCGSQQRGYGNRKLDDAEAVFAKHVEDSRVIEHQEANPIPLRGGGIRRHQHGFKFVGTPGTDAKDCAAP